MKLKNRSPIPLPSSSPQAVCTCLDPDYSRRRGHWQRDFKDAGEALRHVESICGEIRFKDDWLATWDKDHIKYERWLQSRNASNLVGPTAAPASELVTPESIEALANEIEGPQATEIARVLANLLRKASASRLSS